MNNDKEIDNILKEINDDAEEETFNKGIYNLIQTTSIKKGIQQLL